MEIKLKNVQPAIPDAEEARTNLIVDLEAMGCAGLIRLPWCLKDDTMVAELVTAQPNQFMATLRADPLKWTAEAWRKVYGFTSEGCGMCGRKARFVDGFFNTPPHKHDGYAVEECTDPRARIVLAFLVPIVHPEKPHRMTVRMANTLLGAYTKKRDVDWGVVIRDLVQRLVAGIGKTRPTPICPFIYHLYRNAELLTKAEEEEYEAAVAYDEAGVIEEDDEEEDGMSEPTGQESEEEAEPSEPDAPLPDVFEVPAPVPAAVPTTRMKTTQVNRRDPAASRGEGGSDPAKRATRSHSGQPTPAAGDAEQPDTMGDLVRAVSKVSQEYDFMKMITQEMCQRLGGVSVQGLVQAFDRAPTAAMMEELQKKMSLLTMENSRLRRTVALKDEELNRIRIRLNDAHQDILLASECCRVPADTVKKAELFEAGITKSEVFKGDTFKKFIVASMKFTNRIEQSNEKVVAILERLEFREAETNKTRLAGFQAEQVTIPATTPIDRSVKTTGEASTQTPEDRKGKTPIGEASTPTGRTRSAARGLNAEGWGQSPAGHGSMSKRE